MEGGFPPSTVLLDKYRVESVLGRGGMGVVLRVTHLHLGEELAIKILLPDAGGGPEVHARFLREAQSAVRLRSEHVARVSDVGVLPGGAPYMVMEYLRGGDLSAELARRGTLPPGELVDYVLQVCEALAEAHALGIVHRDIKPSNLFLTRRPDGSPLVKVLDFGISKAPIGGPGVLTKTDTVMGTPGYMSPEQMKASKDVDARSDIWALGIVLYECLHGRRPFDAETFSATVLRAATEPPPAMAPRIPRGLQAVVLRCLEKDREARFPSIAALAAALAPFAKDARSAGIIVERTTAMLRGSGTPGGQAPRFGQSPHATTLSSSAGMMRVRSARRFAVGGVAVVLAAIVALSIAGRIASRQGEEATGAAGSVVVGALPEVAVDGPATFDATAVLPSDSHVPAVVEVAVTVDAAVAVDATATVDAATTVNAVVTVNAAVAPKAIATVAVPPAGSGRSVADAKIRAKAQVCAELEAHEKWAELGNCAVELAALAEYDLSVQAKAEEFHVKAVKETERALAAGKFKEAMAEGNLREAQKQLRSIGEDPGHLSSVTQAFHAAEENAIDDNRRKAQALVAKNDCAGVERLQAQLDATSTAAVTSAVAVVATKCVDQTSSPPTSAVVATSGEPAPKSLCERMDIDDVLSQARNQYQAGFAKAALQLLTKALSCRQDERMFRMAGFYACAAHDAEAAKLYYGKVPHQYQGGIVQRCQQENITIP